jgi:hypothetical protein
LKQSLQVIKRNVRDVLQPRIIQIDFSARTLTNIWQGSVRRKFSLSAVDMVEIDPDTKCLRIIWKTDVPYTLFFAEEWQLNAMFSILHNECAENNKAQLCDELQAAFRPVSVFVFFFVFCILIMRFEIGCLSFIASFACVAVLSSWKTFADKGRTDNRTMEGSFITTILPTAPTRLPFVHEI